MGKDKRKKKSAETPKAKASTASTVSTASIASTASSSTTSMMAALSSPASTLTPVNQQLYQSIKSLRDPEVDEAMLPVLKQLVLRRIMSQGANLLAPYPDNPKQSMLNALLDLYEENSENDDLKQVLDQWSATRQFTSVFQSVLRERWPEGKQLQFIRLYKNANPVDAKLDDTLKIVLNCKSMEEAALVTAMLEAVLLENYGIPYRADRQELPVQFKKSDNGGGVAVLTFRQSEYTNPRCGRKPSLQINDQTLVTCFVDPAKDNRDYWIEKLKISHGRDISPPVFARKRYHADDEATTSKTSSALSHMASTADSSPGIKARLFIFTGSRIGLGNYMNAWRTIQGLCERTPGLEIDWVVEQGNQTLPEVNLPPSVRLHATDSFWKIVPLVRSLSDKADAVISLPNDWLSACYSELAEVPSKSTISIVLDEYNCKLEDEGQLPPGHLHLSSGINAGGTSLGLIKPLELTGVPESLEDQRKLISQNHRAAPIFSKNPEIPCYFSYVAVHCYSLKGVDAASVLALFVEHAKQSGHPSIKVVMPINPEIIKEALLKYPNVFEGCAVSYVDSKNRAPVQLGAESGLAIEVFNCFPLDNNTFRLLMNYAASCDTPIVTTGDQSFIEIFSTIQDGCSFIYQLLGHKQELLDAVKAITVENGLLRLQEVIRRTENGLNSELEVAELVQFLRTENEGLKFEFKQLRDIIKAQPDLIERFSAVIVETISQQRELIATVEEPLDGTLKKLS